MKKNVDPQLISEITLGKNALADMFYGCFRVNNPRGDPFAADREVEIVLRSGRKIKITVPDKMRIDLPPDIKIINSRMFYMEKIGRYGDVMHLLTMRAGWNQTEKDIRRMIDLDPCGTFVAGLKGKNFDIPVGTCSTLPLGSNKTWIGMILVHPEIRRQGIANAMMQHCVKYAIDSGKVINGLDATPMGNTVYGAVGYVNSYRIWRSVYELAEFAGQDFDQNHVSAVAKKDLEEVIRYDASAFVERAEIMRALYADSFVSGNEKGCFVFRDDNGVIKGYCFTRPGRIRPFVGPFIADDDSIARELLVAASRFLARDPASKDAFIDTPESKFAERGVYVERVFDQEKKPSGHRLIRTVKPVRDFTRMYQLVNYTGVDGLVDQFMKAEKLDKASARVKSFRETMNKSVMNYTETAAFMEYERESLQDKFWGITGPEKG
jgi:GNAT superfamily N-acetyltransferase